MNYLTVENVTKRYGERLLFENITFYVNQGDKVALIAKNGTGKTTILRLIARVESPDGGSIQIHPNIRVGILNQDTQLDPELNVFQAVYQSENPSVRAIAAYMDALAAGEEAALQKAMNAMDALQAWDYELRIKQILAELDVYYLDKQIKHLSGGQQKRVALAKVLIDDPDFLILDEPTNHLDLVMIEWLEQYLNQSSKTLLLVTHDRYFLDAVATQIVELDHLRLYKYQGDYTQYLLKKAEYNEMAQASQEKAQNLYRKELDWMRRQPQARTTKAKSRIDAFFELEKKTKRPISNDSVQIFVKPDYLGSKIIELHNISKTFDGKEIITKFEYKFQKGDRVGIVGRNGAGKSTLLNIMAGLEKPDTGKVIIGETTKIGYYTQSGMKLKEDMRVIEVIQSIAEFIQLKEGKRMYANQLLEHFLFDYKQQTSYVSRLSGGEKRRLYLLTILMRNPNFLILDEPTNDLDLMTLQVLEEYLLNFEGCFVIVSHDRQFMDKLVEHTFAFQPDGTIRDFPGNYSQYREQAARLEAERAANAPTKTVSAQKIQSEETRKAIKRVERQIAQLEEKKQRLTEQFTAPDLDPAKITALSRELDQVKNELEERELEWLEWMEK